MEYTWEATGNSIYEIVQGRTPKIVCYIQGDDREKKTCLITATIDMYEALKRTRNLLKTNARLEPNNVTPAEVAILLQIEQALAKSEGIDIIK